jgi:hypothetical protein
VYPAGGGQPGRTQSMDQLPENSAEETVMILLYPVPAG